MNVDVYVHVDPKFNNTFSCHVEKQQLVIIKLIK